MDFLQKEVLEPDITATGNCHSCNELVQFGTPKCPYCGTLLDRQRMLASVQENFYITQAVSSANTIRTFRPAAFLFLLIAIGRFLMDYSLRNNLFMTVLWFMPVVIIVAWFFKYGGRTSKDDDYLESKQKMKSDLLLWLAANILNWITLGVVFSRRK
ncbi:MAG: hypothetical protein SF097_17085 [Acidobacteriota bacterium]|nr:hypothetical protein [Acidobacteriota bacterium]